MRRFGVERAATRHLSKRICILLKSISQDRAYDKSITHCRVKINSETNSCETLARIRERREYAACLAQAASRSLITRCFPRLRGFGSSSKRNGTPRGRFRKRYVTREIYRGNIVSVTTCNGYAMPVNNFGKTSPRVNRPSYRLRRSGSIMSVRNREWALRWGKCLKDK